MCSLLIIAHSKGTEILLKIFLHLTIFKSLVFYDRYAINMTEKSLVDGIVEYIPPMISFLNKHVDKKSNTGQGAINIGGIRDIEETVWSPR